MVSNCDQVFLIFWFLGWGDIGPEPAGSSDTLQKTEVNKCHGCIFEYKLSFCQVTIVSPNECSGEQKNGSIVCAGGSGSGGCQGDSGGSLTVEVEGKHVLGGVLSHGTPLGSACGQVNVKEKFSAYSFNHSNPLTCSWLCGITYHG